MNIYLDAAASAMRGYIADSAKLSAEESRAAHREIVVTSRYCILFHSILFTNMLCLQGDIRYHYDGIVEVCSSIGVSSIVPFEELLLSITVVTVATDVD